MWLLFYLEENQKVTLMCVCWGFFNPELLTYYEMLQGSCFPLCIQILQVLTEQNDQQTLVLGKPPWNRCFTNYFISKIICIMTCTNDSYRLIHILTNVKQESHDVYISYSFRYLYNFCSSNIFISHHNLCG